MWAHPHDSTVATPTSATAAVSRPKPRGSSVIAGRVTGAPGCSRQVPHRIGAAVLARREARAPLVPAVVSSDAVADTRLLTDGFGSPRTVSCRPPQPPYLPSAGAHVTPLSPYPLVLDLDWFLQREREDSHTRFRFGFRDYPTAVSRSFSPTHTGVCVRGDRVMACFIARLFLFKSFMHFHFNQSISSIGN